MVQANDHPLRHRGLQNATRSQGVTGHQSCRNDGRQDSGARFDVLRPLWYITLAMA